MMLLLRSLALACATLVATGCGEAPAQTGSTPNRAPDVVYVPTPQPVVEKMLEMAGVGPDDVVIDLGSGDGRIPITAARQHGATALGIDIDPQRIAEANRNAKQARVTDQVTFIHGDMFEADLSDATVVTLYLLPNLNMRLRPMLEQLPPGTRIVSHNYSMGDWQPEQTARVGSSTVYMWTVGGAQAAVAGADTDD